MAQHILSKKTGSALSYLVLLTLALLPSCGKNSSEDSGVRVTPPLSGNINFLEKVASTAYFCDEAECPSYVVAIAVNNSGNANPSWCTGTLLKSGQVLTSRSCFSQYFFESSVSCSENILIKSLAGDIWGCSAVISESQWPIDSAKDPASRIQDYVLLSVPSAQSKNYPSLNHNFEELKDNAVASVWYANHWYEEGLEVSLQNKKCLYKEKNLISPWEKQSTHLMLAHCELPKSARGSGIHFSGKNISGIIHTLSKSNDLDIWSQRILPEVKLQNYALGNSLSCSGLTSESDPALCEQKNYIDFKLANLRTEMFTEFNDLEKFETQVKEYARYEKDKYIRWTASLRYVNEDLLYEVDFIPECFMNNRQWLEEFRGGLFNMFYDKTASVFKEWPLLKIFSGLDSTFQMKTELFDVDNMLYESVISPRNLKKHNQSNIKVIKKTDQSIVTELKDVGYCQ